MKMQSIVLDLNLVFLGSSAGIFARHPQTFEVTVGKRPFMPQLK